MHVFYFCIKNTERNKAVEMLERAFYTVLYIQNFYNLGGRIIKASCVRGHII